MPKKTKPVIPDALLLQVANRYALRPLFESYFNKAPKKAASQNFLRGNLLYLQQAKQQGGLNEKQRHQLRNLAKPRVTKQNFRIANYSRIVPGTRLIKYWNLEWHEVSVDENGFYYRGAYYKSLWQLARLINPRCKSAFNFFKLEDC